MLTKLLPMAMPFPPNTSVVLKPNSSCKLCSTLKSMPTPSLNMDSALDVALFSSNLNFPSTSGNSGYFFSIHSRKFSYLTQIYLLRDINENIIKAKKYYLSPGLLFI